jgi:hypothetical protein
VLLEGSISTKVTGHKKEMLNKNALKAIPVRGLEGPYGCETSRLPHFL